MDPIILIRKYLSSPIAENEITLHDSKGTQVEDMDECVYLRFAPGNIIFPRDTLTNFVSKRGGGEPYALDSIFFLVKHSISVNGGDPNIIGVMADHSYSEYMQASRLASIPPISLVDRRDLIQYLEEEDQSLTAETASSNLSIPSIDPTLPLPTPLRNFPSQETLQIDLNEEDVSSAVGGGAISTESNTIKTTNTITTASPQAPLTRNHKAIKERDYFMKNEKIAATSKEHLAVAKRVHTLLENDLQPVSLIDTLKRSKTTSLSSSSHLPIIIVPNSPSALLGMSNIALFLLQKQYLTQAEAKKANPSYAKDRLIIEHGGRRLMIIDDPTRLSINEWDHVIAIFCSGAAWQFKGWRVEDPVSLFVAGGRRVGFSLEYVEDTKERMKTVSSGANSASGSASASKGWNLVHLRISRSRRHLDLGAVHEFWEIFESKRRSVLG